MKFFNTVLGFWNSWTTLGKIVILAGPLLLLWFLACLPNSITLYRNAEPLRAEFREASKACEPVKLANGRHCLNCEGKIDAIKENVKNFLRKHHAIFIPLFGWKAYQGVDGTVKCSTWWPVFCWDPFLKIEPTWREFKIMSAYC